MDLHLLNFQTGKHKTKRVGKSDNARSLHGCLAGVCFFHYACTCTNTASVKWLSTTAVRCCSKGVVLLRRGLVNRLGGRKASLIPTHDRLSVPSLHFALHFLEHRGLNE